MSDRSHADLVPSRRGGTRKGAGRPHKPAEECLSATLILRCPPDLKAWVAENGGSAFALRILREAYINAHIV